MAGNLEVCFYKVARNEDKEEIPARLITSSTDIQTDGKLQFMVEQGSRVEVIAEVKEDLATLFAVVEITKS